MRELLADLRRWHDDGLRAAVATIVCTRGSAPRSPGAAMAVSETGEVSGSVSGGCVESAVVAVAEDVMRTGVAARESYGVGDDAFDVSLTCGGTIDVVIEPVDESAYARLDDLSRALHAGDAIAAATVLSDSRPQRHLLVRDGSVAGTLGDPRLDDSVVGHARNMLAHDETQLLRLDSDGRGDDATDDAGLSVFVQSFARPPRMLVFGSTDVAGAVTRMGKFLGFRVTICDARAAFATTRRFPDADEVVVRWPDEYLAGTDVDDSTVICVLTHDPEFDVPLLAVALRSAACYVGAMGSRRTHADRLARLRRAGLGDTDLARLSAPIGLDLGARTPAEIAVSVAAEVVAARTAATGARLTELDTPIHYSATR